MRRSSRRNASFLSSKIWLTRFSNCFQAGDHVDPNIGSEVLFENISQEFSAKEELGKPVSDKLSKVENSIIFNDMEDEKLKP